MLQRIYYYRTIFLIFIASYLPFGLCQPCDPKKMRFTSWRCESARTDICDPPESIAYRFSCVHDDLNHVCTDRSPCFQKEMSTCIRHLDECKPWWSEWSPFTQCSATCGESTKQRYRDCRGAAKQINLKDTCRDRNKPTHSAVEEDSCLSRRPCPRINGGWGNWGHYSQCSATCGIGERTRSRQCNNPIPAGGGLPCLGMDMQTSHCQATRPCPQHGGWCPWSAIEECSEICGGGVGDHFRRCACPTPLFGGDSCLAGDDAGQGTCNTHLCPYNKNLSDAEMRMWTQELKSQEQVNLWRYRGNDPPVLGDTVIMRCMRNKSISRSDIFEKKNRFPRYRIEWTFNGQPINASEFIFMNNEELVLRRLTKKQVGFYALRVERDPGLFNYVCFFMLYLKHVTFTLIVGDAFNFTCNSAQFDELFVPKYLEGLESKWTFNQSMNATAENGTARENYPEFWKTTRKYVVFNQTDRHEVPHLKESMAGTYQCRVVISGGYGSVDRVYITNEFTIVLNRPISIWMKVFNFLNGWKIVVVAVLGSSVLFVVYFLLKFQHQAVNIARLTTAKKQVETEAKDVYESHGIQ